MAGRIIKGDNFFHTTLYEGNRLGQRVGRFVPFTDAVTIGKSVIFNRENTGASDLPGDSPNLTRSVSSAGDQRKFTVSFWFKHGVISTPELAGSGQQIGQPLIGIRPSSGVAYWQVQIFSEGDGGTADRAIGVQALDSSGSHACSKYMGNFAMGDTTKWYHVVVGVDTTQSTASDRVKIYVDGQDLDDITSATYSNFDGGQSVQLSTNASGSEISLGGKTSNYYFDGYMAEVNFIDGTVYDASKFGQTDTSTGRWIPKAISSVTYGTNGFRCEFANTAGQTLGHDTSGNGNHLTVNNISATTDLSIDTPSTNYATFLDSHQGTKKTEGNLEIEIGNSNFGHNCSSLRPHSGKWYAEFRCITKGRSEVGIQHTEFMPENSATARMTAPTDGSLAGLMWSANDGVLTKDSSNNSDLTLNTYDANDIIGIALDLDTANGNQPNVSFYKNGTIETNGQNIPLPHGKYCMVAGDVATGYGGAWVANFGQNPSFSGSITAAANTDGSGSLFKYTPPTGYLGLKQDNLPEGKDLSDFVWIKNRDSTDSHQIYDSSRGVFKSLSSDGTGAQDNIEDGLSKFLKGGFEISENAGVNSLDESYVGWNWVANGGTTSANTDGSGATIASTIQANQTAGFSIVTYTGNGSAGAKIAHGLGAAPEFIIVKNLSDSSNWLIYSSLFGANKYGYLNLANQWVTDTTGFNNNEPTSSVFSVGTANETNGNSDSLVAYCWRGIEGYSKFGLYTGNGNADGPFIYPGFKPSWVMLKQTNTSNYWAIFDTSRSTRNVMQHRLAPNYNYAENVGTANQQDFLSNGIKLRGTDTTTNQSGGTYLYMAFAEHPFNGNGEGAFATAR